MAIRKLAQAAKKRGISYERAELLYTSRGLTPDGIEALPEAQLRNIARRLDYADMPNARLAWRRSQETGDDGRLAGDSLIKALRELDSLRARTIAGAVAGMATGLPGAAAAGPMLAGLAGLEVRTWQALGPVNIGGRTRSIVIHPTRPATIWAASIAGGIWRSDDSGANWAPVDDFMANLAVTSLVIDPTNANHLYGGTGEGFGNGDALRGGGIFETVNGTSWRQIPATATPAFQQINRLAISSDGKTLFAATNAGLHRSVDAARTVWTTMIPGPIADVKAHPTDPKRAVAASRGAGRSWVTSDGGATWKESTHAAVWGGRVELCYARANPAIVYASSENDNGTIWRSADGGQSFVKRKSLNTAGKPARYLGDQGWYGNVIWAGDPTNANLVLVGGVDLWRSTDGGDTLRDISTWYDARSTHADHHAIVADPRYNGTTNKSVWFGNDGGIYFAKDVTTVGNDANPPRIAGWTSRNRGYAVTQFFSAAVNATSRVMVAGAQDNGTLAYDVSKGDRIWRKIFGGDGGFCCADQNGTNVFYGQYVFLNIIRNTNAAANEGGSDYISGQFWNPAAGRWEWKAEPYRIPDAFNQKALFIAPFVLDPRNSKRILAGGESLWKTDDATTANTFTAGPKWARVKPPADGKISAIAISPATSETVWVGHERGQVWRTRNMSAAIPVWQQMDGQGLHPLSARRMCTQIVVSPHDAKRVLAAFGGFERANLWMSNDDGATWTAIAGGLPAAPVRAIAIHPRHADWFYAGTEVGVFASEDGGGSWSPANEGPANVSVDDLIWMGETLICVTHGRGAYMIDLAGL